MECKDDVMTEKLIGQDGKKQRSWTDARYSMCYFGIFWEGQRKATRHGSRSLGRGLNPETQNTKQK